MPCAGYENVFFLQSAKKGAFYLINENGQTLFGPGYSWLWSLSVLQDIPCGILDTLT